MFSHGEPKKYAAFGQMGPRSSYVGSSGWVSGYCSRAFSPKLGQHPLQPLLLASAVASSDCSVNDNDSVAVFSPAWRPSPSNVALLQRLLATNQNRARRLPPASAQSSGMGG